MGKKKTIEQRLELLEAQVSELKQRLDQANSRANWFDKVAGSFQNDPEFDEILRLGREIRVFGPASPPPG